MQFTRFAVLLFFAGPYAMGQITFLSAPGERLLSALPDAENSRHFQVLVIGGSSGGFGAALAAGRLGAGVGLVEDTPVLGGMLSNGVSNIDTFSLEALSGIFDEFREKVKAYYTKIDPDDPIFQRTALKLSPHIDGRSQQANPAAEGGRWEPHVADRILKDLIAQVPTVHVFYNITANGVIMRDHRILGITAHDQIGKIWYFWGDVVIDATHEGDIAAWAGVPYSIGREARSPLEPHAGQIFFFDPTGEILPGSSGREDRAIPSSGFRLTVKIYGKSDAPAPLLQHPPEGYVKDNYLHAACDCSPSMPHGKTEMNLTPLGTEIPGANWDWPQLSPDHRATLALLYRNHALGYLYYLQHEMGRTDLGLPPDEFPGNDNVPYRMFLREGRRIHGESTMTEADINPFILGRDFTLPLRRDSIAIGHYALDAKPALPKVAMDAPDKGDGDFFLANVIAPFQIPYGAIVPQRIDGLLVPVALSATHVAFSAVRMDPTWMSLGQAAGVAAVLSLRNHVPVREVSITKLQEELLRERCKLIFYWDIPTRNPYFQPIEWLSISYGIHGHAPYVFAPEAPLTRADLAVWLYQILGFTPSVSNAHFSDVPWSYPSFREIETLYDRGLLAAMGVDPQWPRYGAYNQEKYGGYAQSNSFSAFHPDSPVTWADVIHTLELVTPQMAKAPGSDRAWLNQLLSNGDSTRLLPPAAIDLNSCPRREEVAVLFAAVARKTSATAPVHE